ncbi:glycoside hydrolase family 28 protein [Zopfochytrium polystomum]|nr:glycoside hydrolase family 28 protein [Zopfochytrium polystomum]
MKTAIFALLATAAAVEAAGCNLAASGGDDGPALAAALKSCATVTVPAGVTLAINTALDTTGLANVHLFSSDYKYWQKNAFPQNYQDMTTMWLLGGKGVTVDGGGTIDGQAQAWYDANVSTGKPILLTVTQSDGVTIKNIKQVGSPMWNNFVRDSKNVIYDGITITSTRKDGAQAQNTDGWDTYRSSFVTIQNSKIRNGDDCVSFKPNSTYITVYNLDCTGSHGISVGSLGQYPGVQDLITNIWAEKINMTTCSNGARIKAWAGKVGYGKVDNVTFTGFTETNVDHPMIIDQCYSTSAADCKANPSKVTISNVKFNGISGTGTKQEVASLVCSPGQSTCTNIQVNNIQLKTTKSGSATYTCTNLKVTGSSANLFTCTSS